MRAMKCWKRLTAFLLSFVMVLGLVLTNGITSEAARKETAWTEDGEIEVTVPSVMYKTHVQSFGWQNWKLNGDCSGTFGKSKRLEGINIKLSNCGYSGSVQYKTHIQSYGWESGWKQDGAMSGTSGQAKRLEAIQIRLIGEMAQHYDIYYRVHAQHFGWLGWSKNGESSGTAGYAYRLEGIQILLVPKGAAAPASNYGGMIQNNPSTFIAR